MAVLLENVTNCVWQAFSSLQQDKSGSVHKSKLKVLTANIGILLDLYGVEKGLDHYKSTNDLNFDHFKYYIQREVFSPLPDKLPISELRTYESKIAEVCWLICRKKFLPEDLKLFTERSLFQIFRIFCLLGEFTKSSEDGSYQVLLHPSEASLVASQLATSLGCSWDDEDFTDLSVSMGYFRLTPFIAILESRCLQNVKDRKAISEAVNDLHQTLVEDVIKKGLLSKRGYIFPSMKEYWFVLRPSELTYYKSRSEKEKSGTISIDTGSRVELKPEFRIVLHTWERSFELATTDHMSRVQWISALHSAIEHSGSGQSYQRQLAAKRRHQRQGRLQEMLRAKAQLQAERDARQAAEGQAKELEAVVKEESKRLYELEQIKEKLEQLLEEETQAKRDEEIVRALQARVLAEEWEKREDLERLQEEQRIMLDVEIEKRREFEEMQKQKELELLEAEEKLAQLQQERYLLDNELKVAHDRIKLSETTKELLEAQLRRVAPTKDGDKIRRTHSFMPSTKERPIMLDIRSSTLRRPTKQ